MPGEIQLRLAKKQELRYGENPHQKGALYVDSKFKIQNSKLEASVADAQQLHGKELSYINLLDADAALSAVKEFSTPAACIVKHATPCGLAAASDLTTAFTNAYAGDPVAAVAGEVIAVNVPVDAAWRHAMTSRQLCSSEK